MGPDETLEAGAKGGALDLDAAERVGTIEHDHREVGSGSCLEAVEHRGLERVVPAADVLQVDDERVETAKLLGRGPQ